MSSCYRQVMMDSNRERVYKIVWEAFHAGENPSFQELSRRSGLYRHTVRVIADELRASGRYPDFPVRKVGRPRKEPIDKESFYKEFYDYEVVDDDSYQPTADEISKACEEIRKNSMTIGRQVAKRGRGRPRK